ncbi:MAG: DMT family transporter [Chloroflexi bacterium]|nr:DMT family transporter [Chloroflexota bacterium]
MGELLALLSGVSYAGSNVFTRRGVFFSKETYSPLVISMCLGVLLFFLTMLISGGASSLMGVSWWGIMALSAAGIIHFVIGRSLNYTSLRLIGANRTVPLMSTNVLFATVLAIVFLKEAIVPLHAVGTASIFLGLVLIGMSSGGTPGTGKTGRAELFKGMAAGLSAGLCYGVSSLFVSVGVREVGSPFAGGLVSYLAAGVVTLAFLVRPQQRRCLACLPRPALVSMLIGGSSVTAAQVFRYVALAFTPVNVVAPLTSTNNLFVPFLSWVVNRKMEVFSAKVLVGAAAMITGVAIILLT